jgi:AcrR family transcriptional regulator
VTLGHHDDTALDVRQRRTLTRLREAVVRLAAEQPVEEITVSDLVRAARVNRTTFYKHAASPTEILAQVLYADLDRVRAGWLADTEAPPMPSESAWDRASEALLEHLERFDDIYTTGLAERRSPVLFHLLVDHFTASITAVVRHGTRRLPEGAGSAAWRTEALSTFAAHGEAGLVEAWLRLPRPREHAPFISAVAAAMPEWLTRPPADA